MIPYLDEAKSLIELKGSQKDQYLEAMIQRRAIQIGKFLGESTESVVEKMKQGTALIKSEWESSNPKTDEEIFLFYKNALGYVYELSMNECSEARAQQTQLMLQKLSAYNPHRVLVYGAGVGTEAIPIREFYPATDLEIIAMDIASKHFKFCNFRILERNLDIIVKLVKSPIIGQDIEGMYDAIVCFDVLEHVPDAEGLARAFYEHLNPGGVLLAEFMFNKNSGRRPEKLNTHPLHIERNKQGVLIRGAHFKSFLRGLGFKCDWKLYGSSWLKELVK